jgi:hypothetical protein
MTSVRVDAQGRVGGEIGLPDPEWLSTSLLPGGPPVLWLERSESAGPVEAGAGTGRVGCSQRIQPDGRPGTG